MRNGTLLGFVTTLLGLTGVATGQAQSNVVQTGGLPAPQTSKQGGGGSHYRYDYATGALTRTSMPPTGIRIERAASASSSLGVGQLCFDNPLYPFELSTTHPATHQELVDWGIKSCDFGCQVTSFTFTYRTTLPSVDLSIAFYLGTTGFGNLGTQVARYSFQGLPPGDPEDPPYDFRTVNTITVDISSAPMCLPDGPIGWSFTNDDGVSGMGLATAPGPVGNLDALDVYDNPPATNGAYTGTFNFGAGPFGSLSLQLEEADNPTLAGVALIQGSGTNPIALVPTNVPAIGGVWFAEPNFQLVPGSDMSTFLLSDGPLLPFSTVAGEVLVDLFSAPLLIDTTSTYHRIPIPNTLAVGQSFYGQAILFGGGALQLTNGLTLMIGI